MCASPPRRRSSCGRDRARRGWRRAAFPAARSVPSSARASRRRPARRCRMLAEAIDVSADGRDAMVLRRRRAKSMRAATSSRSHWDSRSLPTFSSAPGKVPSGLARRGQIWPLSRCVGTRRRRGRGCPGRDRSPPWRPEAVRRRERGSGSRAGDGDVEEGEVAVRSRLPPARPAESAAGARCGSRGPSSPFLLHGALVPVLQQQVRHEHDGVIDHDANDRQQQQRREGAGHFQPLVRSMMR